MAVNKEWACLLPLGMRNDAMNLVCFELAGATLARIPRHSWLAFDVFFLARRCHRRTPVAKSGARGQTLPCPVCPPNRFFNLFSRPSSHAPTAITSSLFCLLRKKATRAQMPFLCSRSRCLLKKIDGGQKDPLGKMAP
jgi:hypothetical protein